MRVCPIVVVVRTLSVRPVVSSRRRPRPPSVRPVVRAVVDGPLSVVVDRQVVSIQTTCA